MVIKMYVGQFLINSTGNKSITGLGFKPSVVVFHFQAHVTGTDVDETGSQNANTADCYQGGGTGYANGSGNEQCIHSGGTGNSINACSYYSSSSHCIGIRYAGQNGGKVGTPGITIAATHEKTDY